MAQQPLATTLDLNDIQGDILSGLPKKTETYIFFDIQNVQAFKHALKQFAPLVKTTAQVLKDRAAIDEHKKHGHGGLIKMTAVNIAFSAFGLIKLGISQTDITALGSTAFANGQLKDSENLGDTGTGTGATFDPDWDPAFKKKIDGLIFVAGDSHASVDEKVGEIKHIFGHSILQIASIRGDVRPGKEAGHEHFGFLDGISNPSVIDFDKNPPPGPKPVRAGALLCGHPGDLTSTRPSWSFDGSFLVFRYLFQLVPEFDQFLRQNPVVEPGLSPEEGSELRGARFVGRWKSGAPIDVTPLKDDPALAKDPQRINNFQFTQNDQTRCPFAAHVRKTLPRADLEGPPFNIDLESRRITRRGVQFGPEVTDEEKRLNKTQHGRGLLFVSYQSSIENGFQFIQHSWANTKTFPPQNTGVTPGIDPIIGQADGAPRDVTGTNPVNVAETLTLPVNWVVPRGGEYFFSPSIKALKETLAA
ncbi:Dyp-type peroxidase [Mycena floridula]|nr:Dyp-type peroxidase [Mycena floridula]